MADRRKYYRSRAELPALAHGFQGEWLAQTRDESISSSGPAAQWRDPARLRTARSRTACSFSGMSPIVQEQGATMGYARFAAGTPPQAPV